MELRDESAGGEAQREAEFRNLRSKWGVCRPMELQQQCDQRGADRYIIDRLIPERSLNLLVGDSGLGKSPLAYQMAICVAAGIPFLGNPVRQGRVLYLDFENGSWDVNEMVTRLSQHLCTIPPADLVLWNINDCKLNFGRVGHTADELIRDVNPRLVLIDPLSAPYPDIEKSNSDATRVYMTFRSLIRQLGCAIVNLHHRKKPLMPKPGQSVVKSLEDSHFREWFVQARGPSVLVNGADIRIGVDRPAMVCAGGMDVALVMRGYGRIRGEIPTIHLSRVLDQHGDPVGYQKVTGLALLHNHQQEATFLQLPERFAFKDAKREYGKGDQATSDFLQKCVAKGILRQAGRGIYEKVNVAE